MDPEATERLAPPLFEIEVDVPPFAWRPLARISPTRRPSPPSRGRIQHSTSIAETKSASSLSAAKQPATSDATAATRSGCSLCPATSASTRPEVRIASTRSAKLTAVVGHELDDLHPAPLSSASSRSGASARPPATHPCRPMCLTPPWRVRGQRRFARPAPRRSLRRRRAPRPRAPRSGSRRSSSRPSAPTPCPRSRGPHDLGLETFGAYGTRWLAHQPDLRPSTRGLYGLLWRRWLEPVLGAKALTELSPELFRTWFVE